MKLISTTLSGNAELQIVGALESVSGFVDQCLVIDTGITDHTLELAYATVGDKLVVRKWPWRDDFAAARNAALGFAAELGADWAITVDTDERIAFKATWSRWELANNDQTDVLFTYTEDDSYTKERIIHLGRDVVWEGAVHERTRMRPYDRSILTLNVAFRELRKTEAQLAAKFARDLPILQRMVADEPEQGRWHFYLGATLENLNRLTEAAESLRRSIELNNWAGYEGFTALKRLFVVLGKLDRWDEAVEVCERGLVAQPGESQLQFYLQMATHKGRIAKQFGHA